MAAAARSKRRPRSRIKDLFFIRRRPRWRGVDLEWEKPDDEEDWQKMIHDEGFISVKHWKQDDLTQYPIIQQDLADLEEHLLPTFFEFSQKAAYYQNQFYKYQWVFIVGAFATTALAALATYYSVFSAAMQDSNGAILQQVFSYATAIVGAITAFTTTLSNRGEPQKRWAKTRRLTEELRMTYFQYLSHLEPFNNPDRVQKLREVVIDIRVKEKENG